jgi:hypothetical protein
MRDAGAGVVGGNLQRVAMGTTYNRHTMDCDLQWATTGWLQSWIWAAAGGWRLAAGRNAQAQRAKCACAVPPASPPAPPLQLQLVTGLSTRGWRLATAKWQLASTCGAISKGRRTKSASTGLSALYQRRAWRSGVGPGLVQGGSEAGPAIQAPSHWLGGSPTLLQTPGEEHG